ncbi:Tetratricopeptide repeat protein [Stieleria neptunia]|uniref:Tetratricopeptide repeat protein n=1 Tax=Stieleria neptunia TaxID=2527979 RepID=A0A518HNE2_9BACT|nr:tetratricopeptide repeat protein [Stieleria neptunia]QDV42287.1 Tetratricopeptide repeat protein [Stieleria neptunia]
MKRLHEYRTSSRFVIHLALCGMMFFCGCGSREAVRLADERRSSQSAYDQATALFNEEQFESAERLYAEALSGQLPPDMVAPAMVARAECLGALGNTDDAFALLEECRQGLESDVEYHIARGKVFLRSGDQSSAKREFGTARSMAAKQRIRVQIPSVR